MKSFFSKNNLIKISLLGCLTLIFLGIVLAFGWTEKRIKNKVNPESLPSSQIAKFLNSIPEEQFCEKFYLGDSYISVIITNESGVDAHLFSSPTGEEVSFNSLLKNEKAFMEKVNKLLYLKYPAFIADVLSQNNKRNVYAFRNNELIIYYYDYEINPKVDEELFLKVNYNEIKDYLKISVELDALYENEDGKKLDPNKKLMALTFDDGPSNYTNELVDILAKNHAQATFFLLGNKLSAFASTVKYIDQNNHDIGYHSWAHQNLKKQDLKDIEDEFQKSNDILNSIIGKSFKFMRPPYGALSSTVKKSLDTAFILWNVDTEDWRYRDSEYLKNYVLEHLKEGNIILFHDTHKTSVEAISLLLPELYVRGYQVVSVSTLAESYGKTIATHTSYRSFSK